MEEVTDMAFRRVVNVTARPDVFFTEFTNAASFCSEKGEHSTRARLRFSDAEQPIVAQIWGTNPENFREMATQLAAKNFAGIDINMGCPAKKVVKTGGGSGLIKNPDLAKELIRAAKSQNKIPVSVKTRLGDRDIEEFRDWLPILLGENLANLTIHLRTRKEMSKVAAHFELIPEIVKLRDAISPATKITLNGDIRDRAHAMKIFTQNPGVDGFMIGRGIFANIFCFEKSPREHDRTELFQLFRRHLDEFDDFSREISRKFDPLKHFFKNYVKDFSGAAELRAKLFACENTDQVREILDTFEENLPEKIS